MPTIRLIIDPPLPGAWNMAVDEALLEWAAGGGACLRFYQWAAPTLSLGYFQNASERASHAASAHCPLVRRTTGGGAILHDRELTYSFTAPIGERFSTTLAQTYHAFHDTLIAALAGWGVRASRHREEAVLQSGATEPFLCFQRRAAGDVVFQQAKICGSAQRRQRGAALQHGSILLGRSDFAPELDGLLELRGQTIPPEELGSRWLEALSGKLPWQFDLRPLTEQEATIVGKISRDKFASPAWSHRR